MFTNVYNIALKSELVQFLGLLTNRKHHKNGCDFYYAFMIILFFKLFWRDTHYFQNNERHKGGGG